MTSGVYQEILQRIQALAGASEDLETYLLVAVKSGAMSQQDCQSWQRVIDEIDQNTARLYKKLDKTDETGKPPG